jgi:hypothetical protein
MVPTPHGLLYATRYRAMIEVLDHFGGMYEVEREKKESGRGC